MGDGRRRLPTMPWRRRQQSPGAAGRCSRALILLGSDRCALEGAANDAPDPRKRKRVRARRGSAAPSWGVHSGCPHPITP